LHSSDKFIKYEDVPLAQLYLGKSNVRTENVEEGLDDLAEHIAKHGLLEPIVVCKGDDEKYEILSGTRRFHAHEKLNKAYPGEGWDKIPCHIRVPPDGDGERMAISLGEGLTQLPMTLEDCIDICNVLYQKYNDEKLVARKYGISVRLVKKYVKFARLPKLLQDNLSAFHENPKIAMNIALDAVDALDYTKDGDQPAEKVYELAKKLGTKKKISQEEYMKMKLASEENPELPIDEIEEMAEKLSQPKRYAIMLSIEQEEKLVKIAKKLGKDRAQFVADLMEDALANIK